MTCAIDTPQTLHDCRHTDTQQQQDSPLSTASNTADPLFANDSGPSHQRDDPSHGTATITAQRNSPCVEAHVLQLVESRPLTVQPDSIALSLSGPGHGETRRKPSSTTDTLSGAGSQRQDTAHLATPHRLDPALSQTHPQPHHGRVPNSTIRRTSPGLAARLKALGFATSPSPLKAASQPVDPVGRLDEEQLRQLDTNHQAASISPVIARRGKPWRGTAAAALPRSLDLTRDPVEWPAEPVSPPKPTCPSFQAVDATMGSLHPQGRPPSPNPGTPPGSIDLKYDKDPLLSSPAKTSPSLVVAATVQGTTVDYVPGLDSYFTPGPKRPGSIYTLSRVSFANQLAQLTSLQLPDAESLSSKVSAIPTAQTAATALINAAEQIRSWIAKAQEVINGLDGEDDVEWAAAGGREGLEEVENAITRFERLVSAFIGAIEELQNRADIATVAVHHLTRAVGQIECVVDEWATIRASLQNVRGQVEIAMEWEELWNNVLGDIQGEMDELGRLVFEMEEHRHRGIAAAAAAAGSGDGMDIGDFEKIVEGAPMTSPAQAIPKQSAEPRSSETPSMSQDDSNVLALFARMQPLRASLDFLPMRLSVFAARAETAFPSACQELETRRADLDASYLKLQGDAESLRRELGEDRWVIVFRGAGRQAQKMLESVERSLVKLREAVDAGLHLTNLPALTTKMDNYETKRTHYGPAIDRVLFIIDKGVRDRLTVNGKILRLHSDLRSRWATMQDQIRETDAMLEDLQAERRDRLLRDSVSSMLSYDASPAGSGHETPGSSPPSSVVMSSLGFDPRTPLSKVDRSQAARTGIGSARPANKRFSSLPTPTSQHAGATRSRLSTIPAFPGSAGATPLAGKESRPPWNRAADAFQRTASPNATALPPKMPTRMTPSLHRTIIAQTPSSIEPETFARASPDPTRANDSPSRLAQSRIAFRERLTTPGPYSQQALSKPRLLAKASMSALSAKRRASVQPAQCLDHPELPATPSRPASSLAVTSRRTSFFPLAKGQKDGSNAHLSPGLASLTRFGGRKSTAGEPKEAKPRWRH